MKIEYNNNEPLIMGVDVARFGSDKTVFAFRQGRNARVIPFKRYLGDDTMIIANALMKECSPVNGNNPRTSTRVTSWFIPFCFTILS
jgi:hypothetical protein